MSKDFHKEKYTSHGQISNVSIQENEIVRFNKTDELEQSFRVYKDGKAGIYFQQGKMNDDEGYAKAEKNLELDRPYPFELETGNRSRDKVEKLPTDAELMALAKKCLKFLKKNYPDYTFEGEVGSQCFLEKAENDLGLNYSNRDGNTTAGFSFKHKDSKDISDGYFSFTARTFSYNKFKAFANRWLENFTVQVEMPEECIIMDQYYELTGKLKQCLDVEALKRGTSLLSGKIGQEIFSKDFSVLHDVSDKTTWMTKFWDGDCLVPKGDKVYFIKNGKVLRGYADKKTAKKYHVKAIPGSACTSFNDIPKNGGANMTIKPSRKSAKELLNGKLAIIPIQSFGGGFKEKGEYTMPVQIGLLTDGEKILGRVPPFTISTNMFDMFGKDFIGVSKYNQIKNDKVILFKAQVAKL